MLKPQNYQPQTYSSVTPTQKTEEQPHTHDYNTIARGGFTDKVKSITVLIDLASNGIPFGSKIIRKV